ncbi:MAG: ABC transporter permease [Candidatus Thorarchaeota archaeon]|jgi:peptide/nickel transport system permease protein
MMDEKEYQEIPLEQIAEPIKWHAKVVSIGAFLLLVLGLLIIVDIMVNTLIAYTMVLAGLGEELVAGPILGFRASGYGLIAALLFLRRYWRVLYRFRAGQIAQKILFLGIVILIGVLFSLGAAIIVGFAGFLWSPKRLEGFFGTYRFSKVIYRSFVGWIAMVMLLEAFLVEDVIGVTLLAPVLSVPLASFMVSAEIGQWALIALVVIIPIFWMLPRLIEDLWRFRLNIRSFWVEFIQEPMGVVGLILIGSIVIMALLAPLIATHDWGAGSLQLEDILRLPGGENILGTNHHGQDIFSRIIYASQISLIVGFAAAVMAVSLGTLVGLASGYFGGFLDSVLMRVVDVFLCLPTLPLMLIFLMIFGPGLQNIIIVIAILGWTGTARMVRSEALSLRERPLTEAAHAIGATDGYIVLHHILPNTLPLILANMILGVVNAILSEAGLAFLGFADIHGQPSWGIMLHWAFNNGALLNDMWWWIIPPGLLIMLTTLGFVFVSHATDKVVNPRLRGRRT